QKFLGYINIGSDKRTILYASVPHLIGVAMEKKDAEKKSNESKRDCTQDHRSTDEHLKSGDDIAYELSAKVLEDVAGGMTVMTPDGFL
ncbi:MAG: hypothetical protein Q4B54_14595, partial [Coriobacteriales bacterium]|nr:hypothetical protein [Coriobacteriales bacterium]